MLAIYTLTLFLSAALMFSLQPMFGKMALPLLGGSPAVWNTVVAFCQGMLLLGYLYAHLGARWLGVRTQAIIQFGIVLLPLLLLPMSIPDGWGSPREDHPVPYLLALLTAIIGLPLFVVAATSPMLQKWFSSMDHPKATDPYFLYAASNAGSLAGLLGYPLLLEPFLPLDQQSCLWAFGYSLLVILILSAGGILLKYGKGKPAPETGLTGLVWTPSGQGKEQPLTVMQRVRWVLWAFVPSSLMLSVTTYLSTNIAPVPLLWVIPLALYLITWILAFSNYTFFSREAVARIVPMLLLPLLIVIILQAAQPIAVIFPLHLAAFFFTALMCHQAVAAHRPNTAHLTEFYFWVSFGGVLGGIFNATLAPVLFSSLLEYPLVLVISGLLLATVREENKISYQWSDAVFPIGIGVLAAGLAMASRSLDISEGPLAQALVFGVPAALCYGLSRHGVRFALGLAALLLAGTLYEAGEGDLLLRERTFFGIHQVLYQSEGPFHVLSHSGTVHGRQSLEPERGCEPLSYYHPTGPLGQIFSAFGKRASSWSVGAVGLGAGSIVAYSQPGQRWTFYEIDPTVANIARDDTYFSFLSDCAQAGVRIVVGDARLSLEREPTEQFDLLILDAYNSDAVPVHLITREALDLYLDRLKQNGLLAFHISNQYLDLNPVMVNLARSAGLIALLQEDVSLSAQEKEWGKEPSQWVVMARKLDDFGSLPTNPSWRLLGEAVGSVWTDSYSSVFSVLKW